MKKFRLSLKDVYDMMKLSTVVDVDERDAFGDGERMLYFIRKRAQEMKEDVAEIFGFDIETVKQLNKEQFEIFIQKKDAFEKEVLRKFPCIVTTIGAAGTKAMTSQNFKRVVIDEATMIKEHEAFLSTLNAEQIVLVGD